MSQHYIDGKVKSVMEQILSGQRVDENVQFVQNWIETKLQEEKVQDVRRIAYKALMEAIRSLPKLFPTQGVVKEVGGYKFLAIDDKNRYIDLVSGMLELIETSLGGKNELSKECKKNEYLIVPPPSPSGSHITLRNIPPSFMGKNVSFSLNFIDSYYHDNRGHRASNFDPNVYPCRWFVIYVSFGPELSRWFSEPPHISVASSKLQLAR